MPNANYSKILTNSYLSESKVINASTEAELAIKVKNQRTKWSEQEKIKKQKDNIEKLKEQAESNTQKAKLEINTYQNILADALKIDNQINWVNFYKTKPLKKFSFTKKCPTYYEIANEISVPKENWLAEFLFNSIRKNRLEKEEEAKNILQSRISEIEKEKIAAMKLFDDENKRVEETQAKHNKAIDTFKSAFKCGDPEAIEKYIKIILNKSQYPKAIYKEFTVKYDTASGTVIINYFLPNPDQIPKIVQYKYVISKKDISPVEMKKNEFKEYYDSIIFQVTLRTIHEVFQSVYINEVQAVIFNGWVKGIDPKTGNNFTSCIITCYAPKKTFETLNLTRVNPKECIRSLKGIFASTLAELAPVKPIMDIDRNDKRFIESRNILSNLDETKNLAVMDWEDFEHLVRELFEKIFSKDGAEVKVTQASRDGGVDAIAYDPDPIKGGKFVIQAKRYNNVVPVSAVRDLYGTMINEGAVKGILVTTSYYGSDSREFAKDKPITLIDGSNLCHLFQEHGHDVHIELRCKNK